MLQRDESSITYWSEVVRPEGAVGRPISSLLTLGVLRGEGVGTEVINASLEVLGAVAERAGLKLDIRTGGPIGRDAEKLHGTPLSEPVVEFIRQTWADGGAILCGPGGGRFVYDLRKRLDLFFKISPLMEQAELAGANRLKPEAVRGLDLLVARENVLGVYQGQHEEGVDGQGIRYARHTFIDTERAVRRFLHAAARLAAQRRGQLTVVYKESGVPTISALWRDCAREVALEVGVSHQMVDVDLMAYRLIQHAQLFDVVAAPNLCGDVLADLGAVLLASRGLAFSGNYTAEGHAVYQTNHGAAYDLAGTDRANPVGQIYSLAMTLRQTYHLDAAAGWIERAVRAVWAAGYRTEDIAEPGCTLIGTREMGRRIAETIPGIAAS